MKSKTAASVKSGTKYYIDLICVGITGFFAAYMTLPQVGKWASVPFGVICGLLAGFTGLKWLISAGIFGIMTYFTVSFFVGGLTYSATSALFVAVMAITGGLAAKLIKKRRTVHIIAAAVLIAASCVGHFVLFGNPVMSFSASDMIESYVSETYDDTVHVSGISYNRALRTFYCRVYGDHDRSVEKSIYCNGRTINDTFRDYAETSLMSDARLKLQLALREEFPNGKFTVISRGISGFPDGIISFSSQYDDISRMSFDIEIPTALETKKFAALAKNYVDALAEHGFCPASLKVRGGDAGKLFLTVESLPSALNAPVIISYETGDIIADYALRAFAASSLEAGGRLVITEK